MSPAGIVGRVIAAIGAVLMGASLFLDIVEGGSVTYWDELRRMDIVILVLAVAVIALLALSFVSFELFCLFAVGVIGGYGLGFFSDLFIEFSFDKGIGTWLANIGSAGVVLGAAIALIPAMLGRSGKRREPAFVPADTGPVQVQAPATQEPTPAPTPAPAEAAPTVAAGWYPDPSGQARLRYWDGQTWTDQTQE